MLLAALLIRHYEILFLKARGLCPENLEEYNGEVLVIVLILAVIGARIVFVITNWSLYANTAAEMLAFWRGGFAYHGGFIAALLGIAAMARFRLFPPLSFLNAATPYTALAYGIGRMCCFLNGCCYGRETNVPWGWYSRL